jgi:hypothetical protein
MVASTSPSHTLRLPSLVKGLDGLQVRDEEKSAASSMTDVSSLAKSEAIEVL